MARLLGWSQHSNRCRDPLHNHRHDLRLRLKMTLSNVFVELNYVHEMFNMPQKLSTQKPTHLQKLSRNLYATMAFRASSKRRPTDKGHCSELRRSLFTERKNQKETLHQMWLKKVTNASSKLRPASQREMVMQKMSPKVT